MKKIGLIGGIGPESTLDYYRLIIRAFQERKSADYPEILVYSANLTELLKLMEEKRWDALTEWLLHKTELPLILTQDEFGIPFLNTTAIHADAMVLCSLGFTPND